ALLARRLARRGLPATAGALAAAFAAQPASAAPTVLVIATIQTGLTGATSATVAGLTQGVLQAMFLSKLKFGALFLMSVIAFAGAGFAAYAALRPQPIDPAATAVPSREKKPANEKQAVPQRAAEPEETDLVGEKVLPA